MKLDSPFPMQHDLHLHSNLSDCCQDPWLVPANIYDFAAKHSYDALCLTDHMWEESVAGADDWYRKQSLQHIRQALPLPQGKTPFYFGCETEYVGDNRLGIRRETFSELDFVVIPVNHFHKVGLVRPAECDSAAKIAKLYVRRLQELLQLDLDWSKVGIPHLTGVFTFPEGDPCEVFRLMSEPRLQEIFQELSSRGTGIELNADAFFYMDRQPQLNLKLYRIAKEAGCKFYLSSDAHEKDALARMPQRLEPIVERLGLKAQDRYRLPIEASLES